METAIVWFRRDLRLANNAALHYALASVQRIIPVYIHAPEELAPWAPGAASNWWLHCSLAALADSLGKRGSRLVIRTAASALGALRELITQSGARLICWNRLYEPAEAARDRAIQQALAGVGIEVGSFAGHLLLEPGTVRTSDGRPYRVYTPFARAARQRMVLPDAVAAPRKLPGVPAAIESSPLDSLDLRPRIAWDAGLARAWQPGEAGAHERLRALPAMLADYAEKRDVPAADGTSRLSPHLHFGEVSPAQVWRVVTQSAMNHRAAGLVRGAECYERELLWRDFAQHVLHHYPRTANAPLDPRFEDFPWRRSPELTKAWQRGETGIPIVDAGMRELWVSGTMHNRVRMITASFLTKHARLHWLEGARWFWDTLVDADLASNTLNWQWAAGCGADAAPYFRIFNPVLQSTKFDAQGEYIARWLPQLKRLPAKHVHAPWQAPAAVFAQSGVCLGRDYPLPVLDLAAARAEALAAFAAVRRVEGVTVRP